jgi:cupin fold WbuC family metalloprotein
MIKIDWELLDDTTAKAVAAPRRRMNHNFHQHFSDTMQRMLNAIEPGSYIRPHKHEDPDKREAFFVLRGRIVVVEFEDDGTVADHILLDPAKGTYGSEIAEKRFHCLIALDPGSMIYEVKDGPYAPLNDKNFAVWAPEEGSEGVREYMQGILSSLGYPLPHPTI